LEAAQAVSDQRIRANLLAVAQSWRALAEDADRRSKINLAYSRPMEPDIADDPCK
jgi:hypothetical protein